MWWGYGGGTDSTAMLIGLWKNHIPVDLILFADPGGEQPHTYAYLEIMDRWLKEHDMPPITRVWYQEKSGQRLTLEQECLRLGRFRPLPMAGKAALSNTRWPHRSGFATNTSPAWIHGQEEKRWSNLLGMMPERNAADRGGSP